MTKPRCKSARKACVAFRAVFFLPPPPLAEPRRAHPDISILLGFPPVLRSPVDFLETGGNAMNCRLLLLTAALTSLFVSAHAQDNAMSFFVTSANPGKGGDLGGLAGADAYCNQLATAGNSTGKTWKA